MANERALEAQDKKEFVAKGEHTVPVRYYTPSTDISETEDGLKVVLEVPGVERKDVNIQLENNVLQIEGRIDSAKYEGLEPLYSEYNVGHFKRSFSLSGKIDQEQIGAQLDDGVLTITLRKSKEAIPRRIPIG